VTVGAPFPESGIIAAMSTDILADLKSWLAQLIADAPHRHGQLPEVEIDYVRRAIDEIERLRADAKK
jgi:hypothetical protein